VRGYEGDTWATAARFDEPEPAATKAKATALGKFKGDRMIQIRKQ
jgi:hypothetical protein